MIIISSMEKVATKKSTSSSPGCKDSESLLYLAQGTNSLGGKGILEKAKYFACFVI